MSKTVKSKVMTIANKLVGKGYSRASAMVKAWVLAKAENLTTRIVGTSFNNRQSVLKHLQNTKPANVKFKREVDNTSDSNAVSVWVAFNSKGYHRIGYLPKLVASILAPLIDKGKAPDLKGLAVTGGYNQAVSCGARLSLAI